MKKISIIIPCYNEEQSLPLLYNELKKIPMSKIGSNYEWEFLFINDGSIDCTLKELELLRNHDERVNYLDLSRNFGKEAAMLAGFDFVSGDCAVIIDADLQHPPLVILDMLEKWEEGFDDVYAKRLSRGKESWLRKTLSLLYYKLLNKSSSIDILPNIGDFRLLDRQCINALRELRESNRYTKGMFCYIGYKKTFVEFIQNDRVVGKSSWNYSSLFKLAIEGITSYTTAPLHISTILGVIVSVLAFLYMIFIFVKALIFGDPVQGFPTLMVVILFVSGVQLLSLGIIGEYLGKVFTEVKKRPIYFARTFNGNKITKS